jgi:hypothetical protein
MNNDLFFMTMAVLSVWREHNSRMVFSSVFVSENFEDYEIKIIEKSSNKFGLVLDLFQNVDYEQGHLYMTITPCNEIIAAAESKKLSRLVYFPNEDVRVSDGKDIKVEPFVYTFGKIIDILSCYKPKDAIINTI